MVMEAITKEVLPEDLIDKQTACPRRYETKKVLDFQSDFEKFVIRQCQKVFTENAMVVFCQAMSVSLDDRRLLRNKLWHKGMELTSFTNDIVRKAIDDTRWQNLEPLTKGHNLLVTGKETCLYDMVKIIDKSPYLFVIGGLVENRILNQAEIIHYSKIQNIGQVHSELAGLLDTSTSRTYNLLNSHQQQLVVNLDQYVKDKTPQTS